jgi:hypothetical protein
MYLLYVDESGDIGMRNSPTRFFALSGFVVHELKWHAVLETIIEFRRNMKARYGLKLREEIHASHFIHKPGELSRIHKSLRLQILKDVVEFEAGLSEITILNVLVDKQDKTPETDIFDIAWTTLIQRFHNTILHRNFPGPQNAQDYGILVADNTDEAKLRLITRKMRKYNPIPSKFGGSVPTPVTTIIEDPSHRDSRHSYFVQFADVNAFALYQKHEPSSYVKKKGAKNYFDKLEPVLCKVACNTNKFGIVYR